MPSLTEITGYADSHRLFSKSALWSLFDGDRETLNIGHECVDRHPREKIAIHIISAAETQGITYGELADWSNRFANFLTSKGYPKGARIGLMLEPSLLFYASLLGAMKAGYVAVPLFTLFGPDGLRLRIADCEPVLLLAEEALVELAGDAVTTLAASAATMAEIEQHSPEFSPRTAADDMAMYQYTSGTTRELPEAVKHRHRAVVTVIIAALYGTGVRPGDRFCCPSSPAWGHGLWHGTLAPLALGATIASYRGKYDPTTLLTALAQLEVNNLSAAATHYRMLRHAAIPDGWRHSIEKLSFTGEPIDSETAAWAQRTFGTTVASMYGTTEVGVILVSYPGASDFEIKPDSLGKAVPGLEVDVHDASGNTCVPGQRGEIVVRRKDSWFATKDIGYLDTDGYFYHGGRADDAIISAGWTMSAVEIEDVLLKHPDVREVAVIGSPDRERGLVPKAFVVSPREGSPIFAEELKQLAKTRLSQHEYPRKIEFVTALPKLPAGKINRKALREIEQE